MYVNNIDNIINQLIDKFYLNYILDDKTVKQVSNEKKINFVENRNDINDFLMKFFNQIDTEEIRNIINNKENQIRVIDIIKRYITYYYFIYVGYFYSGTIKEFRNNIIQYSKLQETSVATIKNFFDTTNNYQLVKYIMLLKDFSKLIAMTDIQKKEIKSHEMMDAFDFFRKMGTEYIGKFFYIKNEVNVHNLIKTFILNEIYVKQDRDIIFTILNDIDEDEYEYTFIDIVTTNEQSFDFNAIKDVYNVYENGEYLAMETYELLNNLSTQINTQIESHDEKNNSLCQMQFILPIVDDFLRYHLDTEHLDLEKNKTTNPFLYTKNIKHIANSEQKKKRSENTKATIIINKIDALTSLYSETTKQNPEIEKEIKKYFTGPLSYRKAVTYNYLDEIKVREIVGSYIKSSEHYEYFLEIKYYNKYAYINFNNFNNVGTSVNLNVDYPINVLRESNIEFNKQMKFTELDIRTGVSDTILNIVGLSFYPLTNKVIQCSQKHDLINIRDISVMHNENDKLVELKTDNGFEMFLNAIKYLYVDLININENDEIYVDINSVKKENHHLVNKVIYWIYDIELDKTKMITYENIHSPQEIIKLLNSILYDRLNELLINRLKKIIHGLNISLDRIENIITNFCKYTSLKINKNQIMEIVTYHYLMNVDIPKKSIDIESANNSVPNFINNDKTNIDIFKINMSDLISGKKIKIITATENGAIQSNVKCKHENDWDKLIADKRSDINKYNVNLGNFLQTYAYETQQYEYICNICGEILQIQKYALDGKFDNNAQQFISLYTPIIIPLQDMNEYKKYLNVLKHIENLINRVSLITETNMFGENNANAKMAKKNVIKQIIDILIKHNEINVNKNFDLEKRQDVMEKRFGINKNIDLVHFFKIEDVFFDVSAKKSDNITLNYIKLNNVLLYALLIFITELNGTQITMMYFDKTANIYTFEKYSAKLFENINIKKNINSPETVPISTYPVLCYVVFLVSYLCVKYKLWYDQKLLTDGKNIRQNTIINIIIHSISDIVNSISMDADRNSGDYVYALTARRLYTYLNTVFRDNDIIKQLKKRHSKYSGNETQEKINEEKNTHYFNNKKTQNKIHKIKIFNKIGTGIKFPTNLITTTDKTFHDDANFCISGSIHEWKVSNNVVKCSKCGILSSQFKHEPRQDENYYLNLANIAKYKCIKGTVHEYVSNTVCSKCNRDVNYKYTKADLDALITSIYIEKAKTQIINDDEINNNNIFNELLNKFKKDNNDNNYGNNNAIICKFIKLIETNIGTSITLEKTKHPIYFSNNLYVIYNAFNGSKFEPPIKFLESENRILFKDNHPHFKTDVYYYTDSRNLSVDVFYSADTLRFIGYKEKHKDFIKVSNSGFYLEIIPSIKQIILMLGIKTKYFDTGKIFLANKKMGIDDTQNYYKIIENLIKGHIISVKNIVNSIITKIINIKNHDVINVDAIDEETKKQQTTNRIVSIDDDIFKNWNEIKKSLSYIDVKWDETNVKFNDANYINSDLINYYDTTSNVMIYYLISELSHAIEKSGNNKNKENLSYEIVELFYGIYKSYNIDNVKNNTEFKRFGYLVDASIITIDTMRKGMGLVKEEKIEVSNDENDESKKDNDFNDKELIKEAQVLDVDNSFMENDDDDYGEQQEN